MRMLRRLRFLSVVFLAFSQVLMTAQIARAGELAASFAHEKSDLKPDPAVRFGRLPNGVRYAILANVEPKGRASLRLGVAAGSLHETEEQRGVAHFLEHMAFNGSTNYPPGTLIEFFQRMGMSFGGDTNAFTSFDRTQYMIELANTQESTLAEGLKVFSDYAGGLLLSDKEIQNERGIILSEKRARDNVGYRTFVAQFEFLLGSTLLPRRMPIGEVHVIESAPRELFVDFYNTWYRPENISLVAVGDFDVEQVERLIAETFSSLAPRAPARAAPDRGRVVTTPGIHTHFHHEPESPNTSVSITVMSPWAREPDTAANRLRYLPRNLAYAMLNRRFAILAKKENAPFIGARASTAEQYDIYRESSVDLTTKAGQWAAALAVGEQELRRALEHGFQPGELAEVRADYINSLEQSVKTAPTRRSPNLANSLVSGLIDDFVYTTPEDMLALFRPALEKVTVDDCLAALRAAWDADHRYLLVSGNSTISGDASAAIAAAYNESRAVPVEPPPAESAVAWGYTDFGPAGTVVKREHIEDLDITLVAFANGVRLNLKKTAFEAGIVRLTARVGNGAITEPADQRGLASLAAATFDAGGLGKHSIDDLRRIFAGKNASVGFRPATDAFVFNGSTTPDDFLLTLQLLTAKITDPGYRPEALRLAQKNIEQMYLGFAHTANGPLSMEVANLLASGDPRFGVPPREVMLSRTLDEVKAWLTPQLARGAIEIGVIGDLDPDAVIAAVAQTLGALPQREERPALAELRNVSFPAEPFAREYTIDSQIPKGLAVFFWPTTDGIDARVSRRLNLLASVFTDRLRVKIREEMAGTYSPRAGSQASDTFPGYGYLSTSIDIAPDMAAKMTEAILELTGEFHASGVNSDELERARLPMLTSIRETARTNAYWLGSVLSRAQEKPEVLEWARNRESDVAAITQAELDELVKAYLAPERTSRAIILPAAK